MIIKNNGVTVTYPDITHPPSQNIQDAQDLVAYAFMKAFFFSPNLRWWSDTIIMNTVFVKLNYVTHIYTIVKVKKIYIYLFEEPCDVYKNKWIDRCL